MGLTAAVSWLLIRTEALRYLINPVSGGFNGLGYAIMFAPLVIMLFASFSRDLSARGSKIALFSIAALEGMSVSLLALSAGVQATAQAFMLTAIMFGGMSLYGYKTDTDLTKMGSVLGMAVWGLLIVSIFGLFTGGLGLWFSYAVVGLFTLLVGYDVQMIKNIYGIAGGRGETSDKLAVICALSLYLDFLNIFIHMLRILGAARND
jgi:FtsH-binding integral membrane protein